MKLSRREFLRTSFLTLLSSFFASAFSMAAWAAGKFRSPAPANVADASKPGPAAVQKYAHFASDYKGLRKPNYTASSNCKNCNFFKPDKAGDAWGKCAMVGSKYVYEDGLCQIWSKKPGT